MIAYQNVNWSNVWWILGADYLTFEGFMGDFTKNILQTDFERKKVCDEIPGENNILRWKKYSSSVPYNAEKNSYTVICGGKKFLTPEVWEKSITSKSPIPPSPTNIQWSCQPFRGWGMKRIWYLSKCHPSTKMASARSSCGGFQDQSFAFQDWKYDDKRHKLTEKV